MNWWVVLGSALAAFGLLSAAFGAGLEVARWQARRADARQGAYLRGRASMMADFRASALGGLIPEDDEDEGPADVVVADRRHPFVQMSGRADGAACSVHILSPAREFQGFCGRPDDDPVHGVSP